MVTIDTAEYLLDKFANKSWRIIDEQLEKGEVTFEESLEREFAMLNAPEKTMLDALEPATRFRPNFDKLIEYCKEQRIPLVVVSGGLEFLYKTLPRTERLAQQSEDLCAAVNVHR